MRRRVLFARRSATRVPGQSRGLAGRVGPSLFLASSGGAPGVRSLRRFNPASGWSWHFCPTGPTCRYCRFLRVPINFRRDDRPPIGDTFDRGSERAVGRGMIRLRLLGFDSRLRSGCDHRDRNSILPWASPLAGLTGTCCASRASSKFARRSPASGVPRPSRSSLAAQLQSAHGFEATPSRRDDQGRGPDPRDLLVKVTSLSCALRRTTACFGRVGAVSPSLQRIDGADASLLPPAYQGRWVSSLSEVLHRP
jgi:hypothetical protein